MTYNILFVEKDAGLAVNSIALWEEYGHKVNLKRRVEEITDNDYYSSDIAIVHPRLERKEIQRLAYLREKYLCVGFILTTGDNEGKEKIYQELQTDKFGTITLLKPYLYETLAKAMDMAIEQAKERSLTQKL